MITSVLSVSNYVSTPNCITPNFGLGNKIFKVAAAYSLALDNNDIAVFPDLEHPNHKYYRETIFRNFKTNNGSKNFVKNKYQYFGTGFKNIEFSDGLELHGDFLSWKYFENCKDTLREKLEAPDEIKSYINKKYRDILKKETVAIHITLH